MITSDSSENSLGKLIVWKTESLPLGVENPLKPCGFQTSTEDLLWNERLVGGLSPEGPVIANDNESLLNQYYLILILTSLN